MTPADKLKYDKYTELLARLRDLHQTFRQGTRNRKRTLKLIERCKEVLRPYWLELEAAKKQRELEALRDLQTLRTPEDKYFQTVTLTLSDGRKASYTGRVQIETDKEVKIVDVLVSYPQPMPPGATWEYMNEVH